mgnify:CR=1 FL=1
MVSPLRLKREVVGKAPIASSNPFLSILVDTGVFHLDQPYEYLLLEKIEVEIGDWVSVPFNGRNCLGLIVDRYGKSRNYSAASKTLPINRKVKGDRVSPKHLELYRAIAARWSVPIFDVLRFLPKSNFGELADEKSALVDQQLDEAVKNGNLSADDAQSAKVLQKKLFALALSDVRSSGQRGSIYLDKQFQKIYADTNFGTVVLRSEKEDSGIGKVLTATYYTKVGDISGQFTVTISDESDW